MKSRRQRAHPQGTNARNRMIGRPAMGIAREAAPDLSARARARLAMLDWHRANGGNISRTARHFGYSRPTVYRWLARFDARRLETLEDRPSRPVRRRRPSWTLRDLAAVRRVRLAYPRWGKDKLRVLLQRQGLELSVSEVGRIIGCLRQSGELGSPPEPVNARMRAWKRPYAVRKPQASGARARATSSSATRLPPVPSRAGSSSSSPPATW